MILSLKIRDLRNNITDIYNRSSVIEKLKKSIYKKVNQVENSLPDKDESITKDNTIAEIPKEYQEDFNNLKKEYSDNEKEIEFLKIFYNKKWIFSRKKDYTVLEMIHDKLKIKREIYHSIVNKIKIKYFKKTNKLVDKLILYPENKNQAIYFLRN